MRSSSSSDEDEPSVSSTGDSSEEVDTEPPLSPHLARNLQQQRQAAAVVDLAASGDDGDEQETQELDTNDDGPFAASVARNANAATQPNTTAARQPSEPAAAAANGGSGDSDEAELMVVERPQATALKKGRKRLRSAVAASPAPMIIIKAQPTECTVCYDPCMISGRHRLVALKCGHLFGKKCIERWVLVRSCLMCLMT